MNIFIDRGCLVIKIPGTDFEYDPPLCVIKQDFAGWLGHLSRKSWWTTELESEFISVVKNSQEVIPV